MGKIRTSKPTGCCDGWKARTRVDEWVCGATGVGKDHQPIWDWINTMPSVVTMDAFDMNGNPIVVEISGGIVRSYPKETPSLPTENHEAGWLPTFSALIDDLSAVSHEAGMGLGSDADIDAAKEAIYTHLARLATPSLANDTMEPEIEGREPG